MGTLFDPPPGPPSRTFPVDGTIIVDAATAYHEQKLAHVPVMVGATSDDMFGADGPVTGQCAMLDLDTGGGATVVKH